MNTELQTFAQEVINTWYESGLDDEILSIYIKYGFLKKVIPTQPCGDCCECKRLCHPDMFKQKTIICLQKTYLLGELDGSPNAFLDITSSEWPQSSGNYLINLDDASSFKGILK
jgi:hypothetical protein